MKKLIKKLQKMDALNPIGNPQPSVEAVAHQIEILVDSTKNLTRMGLGYKEINNLANASVDIQVSYRNTIVNAIIDS